MSRQIDSRPVIQTRLNPDEVAEYQQLADELYDGNLALLLRKALRMFADKVRESEGAVAA